MVSVMVVAALAAWLVTVDVVSQPRADVEWYRCMYLHCTQGLAGRGDGYQCGLDWGLSSASTEHKSTEIFLLRCVVFKHLNFGLIFVETWCMSCNLITPKQHCFLKKTQKHKSMKQKVQQHF